jgi:diguanylate cyclase (GGDEF)-like protein
VALSYKKMDNVESFKRINAQVKNSMTFITSNLGKLDSLSDENKKRLLNIVSQIYLAKNSMQTAAVEELSLDFMVLNKPNKNENQIFVDLLETHIGQLSKNLPALIKLTNQLLHDQYAEEQIVNLKLTIDKENSLAYDKLDKEFYLIATFTLITLIIIMYYIILLERDKRRILKLQDDYKASVTIDKTTGLKNRNAYTHELDKGKEYTVILVDILEFSALNGLYGFEVGDFVLCSVANKISEAIKPNKEATVYKVGADQFAVALKKCSDNDALSLANVIVQAIEKEPLEFEKIGQSIPVQVYCGISSKAPYLINSTLASKTTLDDYYKKIAFFDSSLDKTEEIKQNILMVQKIKHSIANDCIAVLFQPLVDLKSHKIIKYEALVRLQDEGKYISPYFFLELSKKAKLYPSITQNVLLKSLNAIASKDVDVSINLSIEDILHKETYDFIIKTLTANTDLANRLTLELLETEEIQNFKALKAFIDEVKKLGCKIAIDDFGSGYSNYNYLIELDIDILKIDGSLIRNIDKSENNRLVVKSIVEFSKLSGIKTVAEFVENKEIEEVIRYLGVDCGQGYLYSAPKLL